MSDKPKEPKFWPAPIIFGLAAGVILLVVFLKAPSNRYYNPDSGDVAYSDAASVAVITPEIDSRTKTTREKNE